MSRSGRAGWGRRRNPTLWTEQRPEPAPGPTEPPPPPARRDEELTIAPDGSRLGELLLQKELISRSQLVEALLQQNASGQRLGSLLLELGVLTDDELTHVLAEQQGVEPVDLSEVEPDPSAVTLLPETVARSLEAVPLVVEDTTVHVAVADPTAETRARLEKALDAEVRLFAAPQSAIRRTLDNTYRALESVGEFVQRFEAADAIRHAAEAVTDEADSDAAPVVQVVNLLLTQALRDRASDIHVEPQDRRVRLRYRIDGALHDVLALPVNMAPAIVSRVKIMAGLNIVERRRPQDGHLSVSVEGHDLDVRVAISPTIWGEKVVLRLLDKSRPLFRLTDLGMSEATEHAYRDLTRSPFGMVVCSGPTGSGKTTTLYATLLELNHTESNITTIEDPVEYVLPAINQIQINPAADVTFVSGLRSVLRQDPDIILVGEIRDTDTARIAVRSALTGHLVLSTIHATDAASTLQRFVDMGVEPFLLASSVLAVVAQRLVRRVCTYCRVSYHPPADELAFYREAGGPPKTSFVRGEGCNFCANTGYQERIGVYEFLVLTEELRELVVRHGSRDEIQRLAAAQGMRTLRQEGIRLVAEDTTTISEIVRSIWTM